MGIEGFGEVGKGILMIGNKSVSKANAEWDEGVAASAQSKRDDAAVDWLLGDFVKSFNGLGWGPTDAGFPGVRDVVLLLQSTRAQAHLPNRKRLLELVERAMDKEAIEGLKKKTPITVERLVAAGFKIENGFYRWRDDCGMSCVDMEQLTDGRWSCCFRVKGMVGNDFPKTMEELQAIMDKDASEKMRE